MCYILGLGSTYSIINECTEQWTMNNEQWTCYQSKCVQDKPVKLWSSQNPDRLDKQSHIVIEVLTTLLESIHMRCSLVHPEIIRLIMSKYCLPMSPKAASLNVNALNNNSLLQRT